MIAWTRQPVGEDVLALLGILGDDADALMVAHVAVSQLAELARGYTRGAGFRTVITVDGNGAEITRQEVATDLAGVIVLAGARLSRNPEQAAYRATGGDNGESFRGSFAGWTLAERAVLDRYRLRLGVA